MQTRFWATLGLVGWLAATASTGTAAEKIAVVRLEQLLKAHPDTAPAESILERQREEFETERGTMIDKMDKMKDEFDKVREEAENRALSEDARVEKRKELEDRYVALRELERDIQDLQVTRQRELQDHGKRMRERIVEKIRDEIAIYAKKKGYALVLNYESAGVGAFGSVLYNDENIDITDAIIQLISKDTKEAND